MNVTANVEYPSDERILELAKLHFPSAELEVISRTASMVLVRINAGLKQHAWNRFLDALNDESVVHEPA